MKSIVSVFIFFGTLVSHAQRPKALDTLYANEHMNMALFFPSEIKQGITGSEDFVFTYNREKGQQLGLLKGIPGKSSNLLVITVEGNIYSFILKYSESLGFPNRFILQEEAIGNSSGAIENVPLGTKGSTTVTLASSNTDVLQAACETLLRLPERMGQRTQKGRIKLAITNFYYQGEQVFVQFELKNRSHIRFDFGDLKIFKVIGNTKRNASYQEVSLHSVYSHQMPEQVFPRNKSRFVLVFPKFTIGKGEKLLVRLREKDTSRSLELYWR